MGHRLALLISNSNYQDPTLSQLVTPQADVNEFAGVLRDPRIGKFEDVAVLSNEPSYIIREKAAKFFSQKQRDDLLLMYFSGHGVLDANGKLFLATVDTKRHVLRATGLAATFITEEMDNSYSRRQILILDCCHSGAFARGSKGAVGASVGTATAFKGTGYGRIVLTASDATQYAWEGEQVKGEQPYSVFTKYMIEGLRTGAADLGQDGHITVDELYDYVYGQVMQLASDKRQTPGKWSFKQEGELVIAHNPFYQPPKPKPLPEEILAALHHPLPSVRLGIVETLAQLLDNPDQDFVQAAYEALGGLTDDDSRKVSETAQKVLLKYDDEQSTIAPDKNELFQQAFDGERTQNEPVRSIEIPHISVYEEKQTIPSRKRKKWLIIFLLLVVILGVVAAITVPNLTPIQQTKRDRTAANIRAIATALASFQVDWNYYPRQPQETRWNTNLLSTPEQDGKFYYNGKIHDEWGNSFIYWSNGETYRLISYGKDAREGGTGFDADLIYSDGLFIAPPELVSR